MTSQLTHQYQLTISILLTHLSAKMMTSYLRSGEVTQGKGVQREEGKGGFPGGPVVDPPVNAAYMGLTPGLERSHMPRSNYTHMLQPLSPSAAATELTHLEPVLQNKSSHCNEKPMHRDEEWPPLTATTENRSTTMETQCN